jgi:hypothetical protein
MYLGLVDQTGRELAKRGYRRVCIDHIRWTLTDKATTGHQFSFMNIDEIRFPVAVEDWGAVLIALFDESDAKFPIFVWPAGSPNHVTSGHDVSVKPAGLKIEASKPNNPAFTYPTSP